MKEECGSHFLVQERCVNRFKHPGARRHSTEITQADQRHG